MEDAEWVLVRKPAEKDLWAPSLVEEESSKPLKVTFSGPAKHWTDAIPIGNGRLGAMVWGGVASEKLQLNGEVQIFSCIVLMISSVLLGFLCFGFCLLQDLKCLVGCVSFWFLKVWSFFSLAILFSYIIWWVTKIT